MNILAAYLKRSGQTQVEFARKSGVHQSTISRLCDGTVLAGLETALKIEAASGGEVRAADWLPRKAASAPMQERIIRGAGQEDDPKRLTASKT